MSKLYQLCVHASALPRRSRRLSGNSVGGLEGLLKVGNDVVNVLGADGDANEVLGDARVLLLLVGELLVRRGPGVDGEGLGVADVGQVADELEAVDDLGAGGGAALDTDGEDTAVPAGEVLGGRLVGGVRGQAGVGDPVDVLVLLEPLGEGEGVGGVTLGTERERLETEDELLRAEGVEGGAEVAEELDADTDRERNGAKGLPELEAVVTLGRLRELGEARRVLAPVELARVDDDTANGRAVAADPLGRRVDDNVRTVLDRLAEVAARTEGVVDNDGDALLVRGLGDRLKVGDVEARVADRLEVDGLGLVVDRGGNVLGLVAGDKLGRDAETGEDDLELVVGAAVEVGGSDNVVAGVRERSNGQELSGLARSGGDGGDTTLKSGDTLLEDVDGGLCGSACVRELVRLRLRPAGWEEKGHRSHLPSSRRHWLLTFMIRE